jgi:phthalate 4,5-dioxygenase reductase subunit
MEDAATLKLMVAARRQIATDIHRFDLRDAGGAALPAWRAGAHLSVSLPGGLTRRYSLCSDPGEVSGYSIAVKREATGRGGSRALIDQVAVGDTLPCSTPRNDFALSGRPGARLFIAGGIGITPILSMILETEAEGGPPWKLLYLTRSPDHTAFGAELASHGPRVTMHHDGGDPDRAFDLWPLLEQPKGRQILCCGPRGLMQAVRDMTGHWPTGSALFEDFSAGEAVAAAADTPFRVRLAHSGAVLDVPADASILSVLREAGHAVPFSCESGTCGSCRTGLRGGTAAHRDLVLQPSEQASQIMVCVSRAAPGCDELVLDL